MSGLLRPPFSFRTVQMVIQLADNGQLKDVFDDDSLLHQSRLNLLYSPIKWHSFSHYLPD